MAQLRDLRKRIQSVRNTKKITRTMEMVATAKGKRAQDRVRACRPFSAALDDAAELLASLPPMPTAEVSIDENAPEAVLAIAANRGLCGGFNSAILRMTNQTVAGLKSGHELHVVGKKLIGANKKRTPRPEGLILEKEDQPSFAEAAKLARNFLDRFQAGEIRGLTIVSTRFITLSKQIPEVRQILPLPKEEGAKPRDEKEFLFHPGREEVEENLLPLRVEIEIYTALLESVASELMARRTAMKLASDNADEMQTMLNRNYNRARQAAITQEIAEVVGGAESLS